MFEKNGVGADPDLLRLDAARLFIAYLGVDDRTLVHRVGVIFFGSRPEIIAPLTPLVNDQQRQELVARLQNPARLGWTDHLAALTQAQTELARAARPAIILLTDGKPEWDDAPDPAQQAAYIAQLRAKSGELAQANTPLFIILLANQATDADPEIAQIWQPLWQEMSAAARPGRFFIARRPEDLPGIYHDIAAALTGRQTTGAILDETISTAGQIQTIQVSPGLAQISLIINKSSPEQTITITTPDGRILTPAPPRVRRAGQPGQSREEVWVIEQPRPGAWQIHVDAPGPVTIWQDYIPAPPPPPTNTAAPAPTFTPPPTAVTAAPPQPTNTPRLLPPANPPARPDVPAKPPAPEPKPVWPLYSLFLLPLLAGLGLFIRRRQSQKPTVNGVIRRLDVAAPRQYDLASRRQTSVTLGRPPADIPLPGAAARITIRPGAPLGDAREMLVSGSGDWRLNGRNVPQPAPLHDTDVIDLAGVKLRYENLPLRRAARTAPVKRQPVIGNR